MADAAELAIEAPAVGPDGKPRVALVLGSALCMQEDADAARALFDPAFVIASWNAAQVYRGRVDKVNRGGRDKSVYMTWIALRWHAEKIVLAGMPETLEGGHLRGRDYRLAPARQRKWVELTPLVRDRIRSMSGWTREHFGGVSTDWLADPVSAAEVPEEFVDWAPWCMPAQKAPLVGMAVQIDDRLVAITAPAAPIVVQVGETVSFHRANGAGIAILTITSADPFRLETGPLHPEFDRSPAGMAALLQSGPLTLARWQNGKLSLWTAT